MICSSLRMEKLRLVQGHKAGEWRGRFWTRVLCGPRAHGASHPNISTCLVTTFQFLVQEWASQLPPVTLVSPEHRDMGAEHGAGACLPTYPLAPPNQGSRGCQLPCHWLFVGHPSL